MMIDIGAIMREELERERTPLLADFRRIVREEMERRDAEQHMDSVALAKYLGLSGAKALNGRLARGSALLGIALKLDGARVWRKSDVDRLLADGAVPRLRAVSGK